MSPSYTAVQESLVQCCTVSPSYTAVQESLVHCCTGVPYTLLYSECHYEQTVSIVICTGFTHGPVGGVHGLIHTLLFTELSILVCVSCCSSHHT